MGATIVGRWVGALLLGGAAACAPDAAEPPADSGPAPASDPAREVDPRPDLLLITLDTTRADRIAPWGAGGLAPNLDALAAESLLATNAHATAPLTFPSHSSMMTGLYPFAHGVRDNDLYQLDPAAQTAARVLAGAGWRTAAVIGASVLRGSTGISRGFERFVDLGFRRARNLAVENERRADEVTDLAIEQLDVADPRPLFLWTHYFDAHSPFDAPDGPPAGATLLEMYDAEVRFLDRQIGRLLDELRRRGRLGRTWIVVVADHGEGLGLQQENAHAYLCEDGTLRVPLFVRRPDGGLRGRIETPTSVADVYPTLLSIAGAELPYEIHGRDLLATFRAQESGGPEADEAADRAVWFETWAGWHQFKWARLEGVIAGGFKYVRNLHDELFDLRDPKAADLEKKNLASERPDVVRALRQRYDELPLQPVERFTSAVPTLPPEEIARLRELGYLARMIGEDDTSQNGTLDPREHYTACLDFAWALEHIQMGEIDDPIRVLEDLTRRYPGNPMYLEVLGKALLRGGQKARAAGVLESALALEENLVSSHFYLGVLRLEERRLDDARRHLERAVELSPTHLEAWLQLRRVHDIAREYDRVLADTIVVIELAAAMGDTDGESIAANSLDEWLPNVLRRLADDPRRRELAEQALSGLDPGEDGSLGRARAILRDAIARME